MKAIKNWKVSNILTLSIVSKVVIGSLLLAHLCFGVLTLDTADNDSLVWTGRDMPVGNTLLQEEDVQPYATAGETETGIIIIGGGGMMLLSNRRSGTKRMNNIL